MVKPGCLDILTFHFFKRLSLTFNGFCHSICHLGAGGTHACHDGVFLGHALYFLANDLILVFDADFAFILVACPEKINGNAGNESEKNQGDDSSFAQIWSGGWFSGYGLGNTCFTSDEIMLSIKDKFLK